MVSIFAERIAAGAPITIHGDGGQTRDFVYVADAVAHLVAAMRYLTSAGGCDAVNVCTGQGTPALELARTLARLLGREARAGHGPPRPGDIAHSVGDPTRATALLGVRAATTLAEGLAAMRA